LKRHQSLAYYLQSFSKTIQSVHRLTHIIRKEQVAIVHVNEILDIYGGLAAKLIGVPCVWHIRAHFEQPWIAWLLPRIVQVLATRIIAVSSSVAEHMFTQQRIPLQKVRTIHNPAPDPRQFHPEIDGQTFREEIGIADNTFLVGLIGKLVEPKGHEVLIRAAPMILDRVPNTLFVIVGGQLPGKHHSEYAERLASLVEDLSLQEKVIFTGFRAHIPQIMAACDVIVHCSTYPDPFPGVVLQGMAVGKPVIATNIGGAKEQIGQAGILLPPRNPDALAEAVITLLRDAEKRRTLGQMATRRVADFSQVVFYNAISSLYHDVAPLRGAEK
jgi:glycosyltransferase involved in cell wall biosynthesis